MRCFSDRTDSTLSRKHWPAQNRRAPDLRHPASVEQVFRVEAVLQCSHQADFISGAAVRQPREFLDTDAMLGGYRAADRYERFRDAFIACVVMVAFLIGLHKKVQIAIGQMTERATVTVGPAFRACTTLMPAIDLAQPVAEIRAFSASRGWRQSAVTVC